MKKSVLSILLALTFALSHVSVVPVTALAEGTPAIILDSSTISAGSAIWFGSLEGSPISWRVLSGGNDAKLPVSGKGEMLLISKSILGTTVFNENGSDGSHWSGSKAQEWCQTFYSNWAAGSIERAAIKRTNVTETADYIGGHYDKTFGPASLDDYFFFSHN